MTQVQYHRQRSARNVANTKATTQLIQELIKNANSLNTPLQLPLVNSYRKFRTTLKIQLLSHPILPEVQSAAEIFAVSPVINRRLQNRCEPKCTTLIYGITLSASMDNLSQDQKNQLEISQVSSVDDMHTINKIPWSLQNYSRGDICCSHPTIEFDEPCADTARHTVIQKDGDKLSGICRFPSATIWLIYMLQRVAPIIIY